MADNVTVVGGDHAVADIIKWSHQLPSDIDRQLTPFADSVRSELAGVVPVLTGRLAGSAHIETADSFFGLVLGGEDVPYAGWIEFGGSRGREAVAEGRYVYPTAHKNEARFEQIVDEATQRSIDRFPWSQV